MPQTVCNCAASLLSPPGVYSCLSGDLRNLLRWMWNRYCHACFIAFALEGLILKPEEHLKCLHFPKVRHWNKSINAWGLPGVKVGEDSRTVLVQIVPRREPRSINHVSKRENKSFLSLCITRIRTCNQKELSTAVQTRFTSSLLNVQYWVYLEVSELWKLLCESGSLPCFERVSSSSGTQV